MHKLNFSVQGRLSKKTNEHKLNPVFKASFRGKRKDERNKRQ